MDDHTTASAPTYEPPAATVIGTVQDLTASKTGNEAEVMGSGGHFPSHFN